MAGTSCCRCPCHSVKLGDLYDALQRGDRDAVAYFSSDDHLEIPPKTDLFSQLESLVACHRCGPHHVRLKAPRPRYLPPGKWEPDQQGDGAE